MSTASLSLIQGDPTTWGIPASGKTFVGINESGQIVTKQNDGTISVLTTTSPAFIEELNTSGTTTITPTQSITTAVLTIQGTSRAVPIVLDTAGIDSGAQLSLLVNLPAAAGLALTIRNGSILGTVLDTFTSDGSILTASWRFYFDGTSWNVFSSQIPAH